MFFVELSQGTSGIPPSQLLMGRQLRTRLDFVIPNMFKMLKPSRNIIMINMQKTIILVQETRNYSGSPNWLTGTVKTVLGPVSYQVEFKDGRQCNRHLDQLLKDNSSESDDHQIDKEHTDKDIIEFPLVTTSSNSTTVEVPPVRHSSRDRRPPDRLTM